MDLGVEEGPVGYAIGANMALRRAAIEKIGSFNELLSGAGDESEWELRLLAAGGRIVYLPDAWVWHRRTARDLQLWRLLRSQFRRGSQYAAFARVVGRPMCLHDELTVIPRFVAHAARRVCAGGLLLASSRVGRGWGLVRERCLMGVESLKSMATKRFKGNQGAVGRE